MSSSSISEGVLEGDCDLRLGRGKEWKLQRSHAITFRERDTHFTLVGEQLHGCLACYSWKYLYQDGHILLRVEEGSIIEIGTVSEESVLSSAIRQKWVYWADVGLSGIGRSGFNGISCMRKI